MLVTDFLEDINRMEAREIEFHLADRDGNTKRLELFLVNGQYIFPIKDFAGVRTDAIMIGFALPSSAIVKRGYNNKSGNGRRKSNIVKKEESE